MPPNQRRPVSYADAGVSIDRGNELVRRLKKIARRTDRPGVMGGLGGFGAVFDLAPLKYRDPLLVSCTDGVGTKIKLLIESARHRVAGIDAVAMCVNDLIAQGAEPLVFLDYFATGVLDVDVAEAVISGVADGCEQSGCALAGGETAEMPGMYQPGDYDIAGFCFGAVERDRVIDGARISAGDILLGLASSGPHANGFSLVRRLLADSSTELDDKFDGGSFADALLEPTRIYVRPVLELAREIEVRGIAHITGGGLPENLSRILPDAAAVRIRRQSWPRPAIFDWLRETGGIEESEMLRTFNCGIGMVLIVARDDAGAAVRTLESRGESVYVIGNVIARGDTEADIVRFVDD